MSWETPAEQIQSSISGPMAKVLAVVVIVVAAFSWVVTPDSGIMGKAIRIVIALAIVGGATVLLGLFNITGVCLLANEMDYQKAKNEVFDFYASQKRIEAYKIIVILLLILNIISIIGCVYLSTKSKLIPYVVEVDKIGEARAIRPAEQVYIPKEIAKRYFLRGNSEKNESST